VQNINPLADLYRQQDPVGVRRLSQGKPKNTAADALGRFGVLGHTAKLNKLKLIPQQFLRAVWELTKALFRVSKPDNGPQYRRFKPVQITRINI
jgi:hypothetical protein